MKTSRNVLLFFLFFLLILFGGNDKGYSQNYALLIGVDYPLELSLKWTGNDARKIGAVLRNNFGYKTDVLTTRSQTKRESLWSAFARLKKKKYDKLIIYFSGHGMQDPGSDEIGYLLPSDGDKNDLFTTAIEMSTLQNLSKTIDAQQILFIIDSCYSGTSGAYYRMSIAEEDKAKIDERARQILTAGTSDQEAEMYDDKKSSVYSYYLERALDYSNNRIRADDDKDGAVSLWELHTYVLSKVSNYSINDQTPSVYNFTQDDGIFVFRGKYWKPPAKGEGGGTTKGGSDPGADPDTLRGMIEEIAKYHSRIVIGFIGNFSGGYISMDEYRRLQKFVEGLNAESGVNRKRIELYAEDAGSGVHDAIKAIYKLKDKNVAMVIIDPSVIGRKVVEREIEKSNMTAYYVKEDEPFE